VGGLDHPIAPLGRRTVSALNERQSTGKIHFGGVRCHDLRRVEHSHAKMPRECKVSNSRVHLKILTPVSNLCLTPSRWCALQCLCQSDHFSVLWQGFIKVSGSCGVVLLFCHRVAPAV